MDRPDSLESRIFSVALFAAAATACAAAVVFSASPDWVAVGVFVALFVIGDRTEIELEGGENINATFMLVAAGGVVFAVGGSLSGLLLARLVSGLIYLPELRARKWAKLAFNTGSMVISAGSALLVFWSVPPGWLDSVWRVALVAVVAIVLAVVVNAGLVAVVDYLADRRPVHEMVTEVLPYVLHELPFAMVGAVVGLLYVQIGPIIAPLVIVPIFTARYAFLAFLTLKDTQEAATNTLIRALESKDAYTAGHVERVAKYADYIGRELQLTPGRLERLRLAALVHDIGKLTVPNELLNKPGRLTSDEYEIVKQHEHVSMELLREIDFLAPVAPSASSEHTHYRPDDPEHPIEPYIVHVADAYDAMTSTRSYRKALSQGVAFAELREKAGTQFHPIAVEALIRAIRVRGEVHGKGHEEDQHLWAVPPPEAGTGSAGLGDLAGEEGSR